MKKTDEKEMVLQKYFHVVDKEAEKYFQPYNGEHIFGDTTFSLLYAWQKHFNYMYMQVEDCIVVREKGFDNRRTCILIKKKNAAPFSVVEKIAGLFDMLELELCFGYVREEDLEFYNQAAKRLGKKISAVSDDMDDDYIYRTEDYLSLDGNKNKTKRGSLNWFERNYPGVKIVYWDGINEKIKNDSLLILDKWCSGHECSNCFYGCEKKAFERFCDIFDKSHHRLAVSYYQNNPLSFAASERIGENMEIYYFQKNASKIRGLMYWLNRQMLLDWPDIKYFNLGEDMGIKGIREDKSSLRPVELKKKYTVEFI